MAEADFFVVYIDRAETVTLDSVKEKMDRCRSWYRINEKMWIVYTTRNAQGLYARFSPLIEGNGNLFICRLDIDDRKGWMSQKFWDWIRKYNLKT
jgi:hypothetical protein